MSGERRFGADELGPTQGSELDDAIEAVQALEGLADDTAVRTGPAFTDRVMAALADEPSPAAAGFLAPLRRRGLVTGFGESLRQAWASTRAGRPAFARAAALAYVLVVAIAGMSLAGAATFGAAGALGLLGPNATVSPSPEPTLPPISTPAPSVQPAPSVAPSESPEPSETAEPSDDHGGEGAEPSDDHSGSGDGGDDGSSGSGGGSGPSATDDHSGSDDGSGSDSGSGSGSGSGGDGADD